GVSVEQLRGCRDSASAQAREGTAQQKTVHGQNCAQMTDPDTCAPVLTIRQTLFAAVAVRATMLNPLPKVRPPLAAKFHPVAAVVPPAMPAVPVPQMVPVPSTRATLSGAPAIRLILQREVCLPTAPDMILGGVVTLIGVEIVFSMLGPADPNELGETL